MKRIPFVAGCVPNRKNEIDGELRLVSGLGVQDMIRHASPSFFLLSVWRLQPYPRSEQMPSLSGSRVRCVVQT